MPMLRPDVGVVLNVGLAHVGLFGSIEETARAKGELVEALPAEGTAVLNADDLMVVAMAARTHASVITFGTSERADVRAIDVTLDADAVAAFTLAAGGERAHVRMAIPGE